MSFSSDFEYSFVRPMTHVRFFFHRPAFWQFQYGPRVICTEQAGAVWPWVHADGRAQSLPRASFGGPDVPAGQTLAQVASLVAHTLAYWQRHLAPGSSLQVTLPPAAYRPATEALVLPALLAVGFSIVHTDTSYGLIVTPQPLRTYLHRGEKTKLNRSRRLGLTFAVEPRPDVATLHALIANTRLRKGYPVTMTAAQLGATLAHFPDDYQVFTARDAGLLVAAAVVLRVLPTVAYTLYVADHADYRSASPLVGLHDFLYVWCQRQHIQYLDLGVATEQGVPNPGLVAFKQHLGGQPSAKHTLTWSGAEL